MYLKYLDGLRGLAVALVILYHARLGLPGGYVGVDVFFVISGYIIAKKSLPVEGRPFSLQDFWSRRIRRLAPALIVCLLASYLVGWVLFLPDDLAALSDSIISQIFCVSNLYFYENLSSGYFSDSPEKNLALHTWSLSVEEQFYILFSLVLALGQQRIRPGPRVTRLFFLLILGGWLGSWVFTLVNPSLSFFWLPSRICEFLSGIALELAERGSVRVLVSRRWSRELLAAAGLLTVVWCGLHYDDSIPFPGLYALPPVLGTVAILYAASAGPSAVGHLFCTRLPVWLGRLSYSAYLWHWIIFSAAAYWRGYWAGLGGSCLLIVATLGLAWITFHWIEQPFRQPGSFAYRYSCLILTASYLLVLGLASFTSCHNGLPSRFSRESQRWISDLSSFNHLALATEGNHIWLGGKAKNADFLLWGDSHAQALVPCIKHLTASSGACGLVVTHTATPPLLKVDKGFSQWGLDPQEQFLWSAQVLHLVRRHRIKRVLFVSRWSIHGDAVTRYLVPTLERLKDEGCDVYVVKDVPYPGDEGPRRVILRTRLGLEIASVDLKPGAYEARNSKVETVFGRLSGVQLIETAGWFASKGSYGVTHAARCSFADSTHLSSSGALRLSLPLGKAVTGR